MLDAVLFIRAVYPTAVLLPPVTFADSAERPIAVLFDEVVVFVKEPYPRAVLSLPVVIASLDNCPIAVF